MTCHIDVRGGPNMSLTKLIVIAVILMVIVSVFLIMSMNAVSKKKKISEHQKMQSYNKRFRFYYDFVLTRGNFRKVHEQIASLAVYNMLECRMMTVRFFERSLIVAGLLFILGFVGLGDIVSGIILLMFAYVMINTTINKRIDDVNFNALKSMSTLILQISECYTRVRNVPDAINDAECPPLLQAQVSEIYLICTANDAKERLNEFYKKCPNRIMRTLATTCYIRTDAGEDDSGLSYSPFKQALRLVKDEVDMEVRRRINQRLMFSALDKLPFVPLFMYPPIKIFYTKMISATASVFDSTIGYVIKLVVVLACFVSYYTLSTMNNASVARSDDRMLFLTKLLYHDKVSKFARTLVTKKFKKRLDTVRKLEGCLSSKDINYFYLEKLVYGAAVMVLSFIFTILILISARTATYNSLTASTMSATLTYTHEQEKRTLEYDSKVLAMEQLPTEDDMRKEFTKIFPKSTSIELDAQVERLTRKYNTWQRLHFKWWFAFIVIACSIAGWYIPDLLLKLRAKLVQSEAEEDVLQLQTIIAILMDTPLDTLSVIYWLSKSSDIHKDILTYCYHEYVRNPEFSIDNLKRKSASAEFSAMCDKLKTTIYQVTLAEAFEDLIAERDNTMKVREVVQLDALKSKRNIAGPIATMPMMVWMVAVFIVPIAIVAVRSAISMLEQLNM